MPLTNSRLEDCINDTDEETNCILFNVLKLNLVSSESSERIIISCINKFLSSAKTRGKGLEFLDLILDNCSKEVIVLNAINWVNFCIVRFPEDSLREAKLSVIGKIVETAHAESEFNKKFISDCIPKIFENCINTFHITNSHCEVALVTLTTCMKCYPNWFGPQKDKIEAFLVNFLDSKSEFIVDKAALAFHYLQQVGGAGPEGIHHRTNFTKTFHKLCITIHQLFDEFFVNERELFNNEMSVDTDIFSFKATNVYNSSQKTLHIVARRLSNCFKFLEVLMKTRFSAIKEIRPKALLTVISRGLTMHKCLTSSAEHTVEDYSFSLLLNEIQMILLKILRLFIIWYRNRLLPFSYTITKSLVDSLSKTHGCDCFRSDCLYQEAVYKSLNEWLKISNNSFHVHFQNQALQSILKDVTPKKSEVTLNINANLNKSSKARKKAMYERIMSVNAQKSSENLKSLTTEDDINRCHLALKSLRTLLFYTELKVKPDVIKNLYTTIFSTLMSIQTLNIPHPYTDPKCQIALYEVLVTFLEQDTLKTLPPLQLTLNTLTRGQNSNNQFIGEICVKGLSCLEKLCQPVCPSLYLNRGDRGEVIQREKTLTNGFEVNYESDRDAEVFSDVHSIRSGQYVDKEMITVYETEKSTVQILDNKLLNPPNQYAPTDQETVDKEADDCRGETTEEIEDEETIDIETVEETGTELGKDLQTPTEESSKTLDQNPFIYNKDINLVEPEAKRAKLDITEVDVGLEKLEIRTESSEEPTQINTDNATNFDYLSSEGDQESSSVKSSTKENTSSTQICNEVDQESPVSVTITEKLSISVTYKEGQPSTSKEVDISEEIQVDVHEDNLGDSFEETVGRKGEENHKLDDGSSIGDGGFVDEVRDDF